ncbi:hypothetical protein [Paenibacillus peoriae]|nr:hypothetical protein [Paenibacillus peoriae]
MNPHWLKERNAPGPTDLASAGLSGCFHSPKMSLPDRGPNGPMREYGVI